MPTNQPSLSDLLIPHSIEKFQVFESNGTRLIHINGQQIFCLETSDETTCRHAAVQLYLCWDITQLEIATAWNVTLRTVNNWVQKYRSEGIEGLKTKTVGAPVKVISTVRQKIIQMRSEKCKVPEICQRLSISKSAIYRVFEENKAAQVELIANVELCSKVIDDESGCSIPPNSVCELSEVGELAQANDPLDRSLDRLSARLGLIDEGMPVFAESDHVESAGVFLAVAMLSKSNFFDCIKKVYITLGPAFYGLQATFMSLFMMAVLRLKNPEKLNDSNPQKLGRLLGLDRAPSVKTLRRKIKTLSGRNQAVNLMNLLGQKQVEEANLPEAVLYVDGHVQCYYGKSNLGKSFSTTRNRALKSNTDYWVNLADGTPLLCIPTDFNQSMSQMLPNIIIHAKKLCKNRRITVVFDRAGSSAGVFEKLIQLGCDFIAYNKNPKAIDNTLFKKQKTKINDKEYHCVPYDRKIDLPVYQKTAKGQYRKTRRSVLVREIIILREDGGQTAIVTNRLDMDTVTIAGTLFRRWSQENFFKYLVAMYDFDHICVYRKEKVNDAVDHPNPEYVQLNKKIKTIRQRIGTILGIAFDKVADSVFLQSIGKIDGRLSPRKSEELSQLKVNLKSIRAILKNTAKRENTHTYESLEPQSRLICNIMKMTAYHIEGKLAQILRNYWAGKNGNERGILSGFMQATGAIKLSGQTIHIILEKPATPGRTRMLKRLCDDMTVVAAHYPGTKLRMIFELAA